MSARRVFRLYERAFGDVPPPAAALGVAGLVPFAALSLAATVGPGELVSWSERLLVAYGAIILSFMGGCRWGFAAAGLGDGPTPRQFAVSVIPALYAWVVSLLDFGIAALALAVGFLALYLADSALTRSRGAPAWWPALRLPLTAGAVASLMVPAAF